MDLSAISFLCTRMPAAWWICSGQSPEGRWPEGVRPDLQNLSAKTLAIAERRGTALKCVWNPRESAHQGRAHQLASLGRERLRLPATAHSELTDAHVRGRRGSRRITREVSLRLTHQADLVAALPEVLTPFTVVDVQALSSSPAPFQVWQAPEAAASNAGLKLRRVQAEENPQAFTWGLLVEVGGVEPPSKGSSRSAVLRAFPSNWISVVQFPSGKAPHAWPLGSLLGCQGSSFSASPSLPRGLGAPEVRRCPLGVRPGAGQPF